MNRELLIRTAWLYLPITAAFLLALWRRPGTRAAAGILLACLWNLDTLLVLHLLATRFDWWRFGVHDSLFYGFPVDAYVGWTVLWGAVPALAFPRMRIPLVAAIMLGIDLVLMPRGAPVIELGPQWLVGETVGILLCLVPSLLFARWTRNDRQLYARASLQVLTFSGLVLGIFPALVFAQAGGSLGAFLARPAWINSLLLQVLFLAGLPGLGAVQEFAVRGRGTPIPYDPPTRLVTSGPYAYIANPMQFTSALVLLVLGWVLSNLWIAAAGGMAFIYSVGLAAWDEGGDMHARFGEAWTDYRKNVRPWRLRRRPWHPSLSPQARPARLYIAEGCSPCSTVGNWFRRRKPVGMEIVAAEEHPHRDLMRMTYDPCDGSSDEAGVAAFARGLEHIHLGWAMLGFFMRMPVVRPFLQLLADASGGGPRLIRRTVQDQPCRSEDCVEMAQANQR